MFVFGRRHPPSDRPRPSRHSPLAESSLIPTSQPDTGSLLQQRAAPSAAGCWPHSAANGAASPSESTGWVGLLFVSHQGNDRWSTKLCKARPSGFADRQTLRQKVLWSHEALACRCIIHGAERKQEHAASPDCRERFLIRRK